MEFESISFSSADELAAQLRTPTHPRRGDAHPFDVWRRFAAVSELNRELLACAILVILAGAARDDFAPERIDAGLLDEVIALARDTEIRVHEPIVMRRLESPLHDWTDRDARRLLGWLDGADLTQLLGSALPNLYRLGDRTGCTAPAIRGLLACRPWSAAQLVGESAVRAFARGEPIIDAFAPLWDDLALPYRAEVLAPLRRSPGSLRNALRSCGAARDADGAALVGACLDDTADPRNVNGLMADALIRAFVAASNRGSEIEAKRLLLHPRDVTRDRDAGGHAYAIALQQEPAEFHDIGLTSEVVHTGPPESWNAMGSDASVMWVPIRLRTAGVESTTHMALYRLGHRFKLGLPVTGAK